MVLLKVFYFYYLPEVLLPDQPSPWRHTYGAKRGQSFTVAESFRQKRGLFKQRNQHGALLKLNTWLL